MKNFKILLFVLLLFLCAATVSANDNITINTHDMVKYYHNDTKFECKLESNSEDISNQEITFNINNVSYTRFTNNLGIAKMSINLSPGNYIIKTTFQNQSKINNITVLSFIESVDLVKYYCNDSQFFVKLLDKQGNIYSKGNITFNIHGVFYYRLTNDLGFAKLNINLAPGEYIITSYFDGLAVSNRVTVLSFIESVDLVKYYCNDSHFSVRLLDNQGAFYSNGPVKFNIHGVFYHKISNDLGFAKLNINLAPGEYIITAYFNNLAVSNKITVLSRLITSGDVKSTYGEFNEFTVKLLNKTGSIMPNEEVICNINGIIYKAITNNEGIAKFNFNLNSGKYVVSYSADGIFGSNNFDITNAISLETFNWGSGANVCKNILIKNNLPSSNLINQIIEAAKSGIPMVTIKGGNGKSVFITSGVHGNELASQIAALRLIKELESTDIDGTVYIIPFVCPKATETNVRNYNGQNLNTVAHIKGTVSYNIVNLIVSLNCDSYGDFHCTQPGGEPGKNAVLGSYDPLTESATLANGISQITGFSKIIYNEAGVPYAGALEDTSNIKGVPSVTCEVVTPHGTIASGSVDKSLTFMKALLKYNNLI